MSWTTVELFELQENIAPLIQHLQAERIAHRVIELQGQQALQVPNVDVISSVKSIVVAWRAGVAPSNYIEHTVGPSQRAFFQQGLFEAFRTPITLLLVVFSVLGFAIIEVNWLSELPRWFTFYTLIDRPMEGIYRGEYWRLVTPAFLHFGIFHIVFNALWIWDLGRRVEWVLGIKMYALFFLVSSIASNVTQHFWQTDVVQFGGMSGVVYALVGYIAVCQKLNPHRAFNIPSGIIIFMLGWLVFCLTGIVDRFMSGGVANGAHVGGLLAGVIMAIVSTFASKAANK